MMNGRYPKRPSGGSGQQLRVIILAFICINAAVVYYVYSIASTCSDSTQSKRALSSHHNVAPSPQVRTRSTDAASSSVAASADSGSESFRGWLKQNPNTPGARFVEKAEKFLHPFPNAEGQRIEACHSKNFALCYAGHAAYNQALEEAPPEKKTNQIFIEKTAMLKPFHPNYNVWRMRRFSPFQTSGGKLRLIHNLGTDAACLPLMLAGASVGDFGVVVELGTYLGLSSKCIGMGFNTTKREDSYFAFDLFGNDEFNYNTITKNMPWTKETNPDFNNKEASYLWLWEHAAKTEAYPTAQTFPGFINATTMYPKIWKKKPIALMSVDSAKTWSAFRDQTAGVQRPYMLKKGALLILMDFHTVDTQIKLMYTGCLRQYLQPVYTSWCRGEQWIFVALQTFSLGMIGACMQDYLEDQTEPSAEQFQEMLRLAEADLEFMDGLFGPISTSLEEQRKCLMDHLHKELFDSKSHWKFLRVQ